MCQRARRARVYAMHDYQSLFNRVWSLKYTLQEEFCAELSHVACVYIGGIYCARGRVVAGFLHIDSVCRSGVYLASSTTATHRTRVASSRVTLEGLHGAGCASS